MSSESRSRFSKNKLAAIADEVISEIVNKEPSCLTELKAISEHEFRYDIIDELESGGMKNVYRAVDKKTRRDVALAYVRPSKSSEKNIRYFINESWITAQLEHPNIVPIYDIGVAPNGSPYFAMKLLSGESLRSVLRKLHDHEMKYLSKFKQNDLLSIFIKICDAISYAHECGVVHLDLKPDNIQISNFGQVLVLDWGIANVLQMYDEEPSDNVATLERIENTRFGTVKGTPGFIAPELIDQSLSPTDYKADIYGLGAILYSILVYERPGVVTDSTETKEEKDLHLKTLKNIEDVPLPLQSVIKKAMRLSPDDRYESVEMLKKDVEAFLTGYATTAEEAGFLRQQLLLIKRNIRFFATLVSSLSIIIVLVFVFIFRLTQSEREAHKNAERALKSEQKALVNEKRANERELVAKQLLEKYEKEREERKRREKTSVKHFTIGAFNALAQCRVEKALNDIEQALLLSPNDHWSTFFKIDTLLAMQKFDRILEEMKDYSDTPQFEIAKKYSRFKKDNELLQQEEFELFIGEFLKLKRLYKGAFWNSAFYYVNKGKTFASQKMFVEKMVKRFFSGSELLYDSKNDRVTFRSKNPFAVCVFVGLKFKGLDLSDTKIRSTDFLWRHHNIEYLNLKRSEINLLKTFSHMAQLKYLNLESTPIQYLEKPKETIDLHYLNAANTSLESFYWNIIHVDIINIVNAESFRILGHIRCNYPPEKIIILESQLNKQPSLRQRCEEEDIELIIYKNAIDVDERDFL